MFDVRNVDLKKLNSATKYPSIPTYHKLDPRNGGLLEEALPFAGDVLVTEKVDGTNARIIFLPGGMYLLGSREELLYAKGDLIGNPALGIVDALREKADEVSSALGDEEAIVSVYCEVYGGKVTAASKQYTGYRRVGFRLFDINRVEGFEELMLKAPAQISSWRENGGQTYFTESELQTFATGFGFDLTPRILALDGAELPTDIDGAYRFLGDSISESLCLLDEKGGGQPEGLVIRTRDRSQIAKIRFQDYRRTRKRRKN